MIVVKRDLEYLVRDVDRHNNERFYVRRRGRKRKIRIKAEDGTPEFWQAYGAAVAEIRKPEDAARAAPAPVEREGKNGWPHGTFGWLAQRYYDSDEFTGLDPQSQITRQRVIDGCLAEPHTETDPRQMGLCPVKDITARKIK